MYIYIYLFIYYAYIYIYIHYYTKQKYYNLKLFHNSDKYPKIQNYYRHDKFILIGKSVDLLNFNQIINIFSKYCILV